jgi:hypothetical protein
LKGRKVQEKPREESQTSDLAIAVLFYKNEEGEGIVEVRLAEGTRDVVDYALTEYGGKVGFYIPNFATDQKLGMFHVPGGGRKCTT